MPVSFPDRSVFGVRRTNPMLPTVYRSNCP